MSLWGHSNYTLHSRVWVRWTVTGPYFILKTLIWIVKCPSWVQNYAIRDTFKSNTIHHSEPKSLKNSYFWHLKCHYNNLKFVFIKMSFYIFIAILCVKISCVTIPILDRRRKIILKLLFSFQFLMFCYQLK